MRDAMLDARGLTRVFATGGGVRSVDLRVESSEIHAIVGLNGAGKSTFMKLVLGMLRPSAGTTFIAGVDLRRASSGTWRDVGHLVDAPFAYPELTALENLRIAARLHGVGGDAVEEVVAASIHELGLEAYAGRRAAHLSLGNRQRVGLAAALQHRPRLVVLDEPTNGLDPSGVIRLRDALLRRARDDEAAILVSSHHLDEVARIADRITVINEGRVIGALEPHGVDIERAFFALVHADSEAQA